MLFYFKHQFFKFSSTFIFHPLNRSSMSVQHASYWYSETESSASVQSVSCYSAVKFQTGKLQESVYKFGSISLNMSDQGFSVHIISGKHQLQIHLLHFLIRFYILNLFLLMVGDHTVS